MPMNDPNYQSPDSPQEIPDSCMQCVHHRIIGQGLECHRYPPSVHLIVNPPKVHGAAPTLTKQSMFPNCRDRCGEFMPQEFSPINSDDSYRLAP